MRVNLGSGLAYVEGWVNVDSNPEIKSDVCMDAFEFIERFGAEIDELYMGHFLEHLRLDQAEALLRTIIDRVPAGTVVSAVTPDMRAVFRSYLAGQLSNRELNELYVYSYVQPCHHVWCHDIDSLISLFKEAGFIDVQPIDPLTWPPVYHKTGLDSRFQCGVRAVVPALRKGIKQVSLPRDGDDSLEAVSSPVVGIETSNLAALVHHLLYRRELVLRELEDCRVELAETREALQRARQELATFTGMPGSRAFRAAVAARRAAARAFPRGSRRREILGRAIPVTRHGPDLSKADAEASRLEVRPASPGRDEIYEAWLQQHEATADQLHEQRRLAIRLGPVVRLLVAVRHQTKASTALDRTLASLARQSWIHWRAAVISEGDVSPPCDPSRVRVVNTAGTSGWAESLNQAVAAEAECDFVMVVDAGDQLASDALCEVALTARRDPEVDLIYWDDDMATADGNRVAPRFRPSWSPELLISYNYLGRSFAMRRARYLAAGGIRGHLYEAAFWDLILRAGLSGRAARIPRILSHLVSRSPMVDEHGLAAVNEYLQLNGIPAQAIAKDGRCQLRWEASSETPKVSIIVPTRHNRQMLARLLPSLRDTDYPDWELVIVDNGRATPENQAWYASMLDGMAAEVHWWDRPFNYSAVNNEAVRRARGEVLIFLNDDTEIVDPQWMREMVGWALRPEIGAVGMTLLDAAGRIQHAGVVLGLNGFADHIFAGQYPGEDTIFGPVVAYRNCLAVTAACLAILRSRFEEVGGFDERFQLCGSDVVLGLDLSRRGYRNVCVSSMSVRHLESATRGAYVPYEDFFASYWRYQQYIFGGDPFYSPNLSLQSRRPRLRQPDEPLPSELVSEVLRRPLDVFRQGADTGEAWALARSCRATAADREAVISLHRSHAAAAGPRTVNWFIPDIDTPYYGGINTAFRIADYLARHHGVCNRFVVWGSGPELFLRSALAATFPSVADSEIIAHDGSWRALDAVPEADAAVATLWVTAYFVARGARARRKFYLIQDYEPVFYPAGSTYALAEESYRLGLYGICNTPNLLDVYTREYGGKGMAFTPAVDRSVFHAQGRRDRVGDEPITVFTYARPGHWRNCWEMASLALREAKERLGDRLRIVTAGSWLVGSDLEERAAMTHLGLLDYRATGDLYRQCDIGMVLTVSRHPSYLPLELMGCGVPVIAFDNPWGHWLLRHEENSLLAERTVEGLVDAIVRLVRDEPLRRRLAENALRLIDTHHSDWESALAGIYRYMSRPESRPEE